METEMTITDLKTKRLDADEQFTLTGRERLPIVAIGIRETPLSETSWDVLQIHQYAAGMAETWCLVGRLKIFRSALDYATRNYPGLPVYAIGRQ